MRCLKSKTNMILVAAFSLAVIITGCVTTPEEKPTEKGITPGTSGLKGDSYSWRGFPQPAPTPADSEILVEKYVPKTVRPQEKFKFTIVIKNNAAYKISNVTVVEEIPEGFKFISSKPAPTARETSMKWDLGTLLPNKERKIVVYGKPTKIGTIRYAGETILNFKVATDSDFASTINVIEPNLVFALDAPAKAIINSRIATSIVFTNNGEAKVIGAKLIHTLPPGLLTYEGKSKIELLIGDLLPREKKEYKLNLKGIKTGPYKTTLTAIAQEGISASATLNIAITKPILTITGKVPKKRFVGKRTPYDIIVKNSGNAIAKNLVINLSLPNGVSLQRASDGGQSRGQNVTWKIASLGPGETKSVNVMTIVKKIMVARAVAKAKATAAEQVETVMTTNVAGIAGLLTTLIDVNDPVPIGDDVTYLITASNTGSLDATKIKIKCELEDSMKFVKTSGATKGELNGNVLTFEPLPALNPQANAKWRIVVKAVKEGDVRFKVYIESDQLKRPVELIESTHFYK